MTNFLDKLFDYLRSENLGATFHYDPDAGELRITSNGNDSDTNPWILVLNEDSLSQCVDEISSANNVPQSEALRWFWGDLDEMLSTHGAELGPYELVGQSIESTHAKQRPPAESDNESCQRGDWTAN